jgi:hypothetical protein
MTGEEEKDIPVGKEGHFLRKMKYAGKYYLGTRNMHFNFLITRETV